MNTLPNWMARIFLAALSLLAAGASSVSSVSAQERGETSIFIPQVYSQKQSSGIVQPFCHFGISIAKAISPQYHLDQIGVGAYLNWSTSPFNGTPENIRYFPVLFIYDPAYANIDAQLAVYLSANPHATWIVGNEPDLDAGWTGKGKKPMSAQTYAQRYFHVASYIREHDPQAQIAFGTIIQPTPVRIRYLEDVLSELSSLAGSMENALSLIDIFAIHAFQLNEQSIFDENGKQISWGAGLPIGYDPDTWPTPQTIDPWGTPSQLYLTYDINLFEERVIAFRTWMKYIGQQNKPLWITEYGSVFPPASDIYETVSDEDAANFMTQTYDFMLSEKDPYLGYAGDDDRLVQQWVWWVLDYDRSQLGGSFWDSEKGTYSLIGQKFIDYNPPVNAVLHLTSDPYFIADSLSANVYGYSSSTTQYYYEIEAMVGNGISVDYRAGATVDFYDGDLLVASGHVNIPRCGGVGVASARFRSSLPPNVPHALRAVVRLDADSGMDTNPDNNELVSDPSVIQDYPVIYPSGKPVYLPR